MCTASGASPGEHALPRDRAGLDDQGRDFRREVWRREARHAGSTRGDLFLRRRRGEHVAFVEDDPLYVLRGANEDKTILWTGFSAGARAQSSRRRRPRITACRTRMTTPVRVVPGCRVGGDANETASMAHELDRRVVRAEARTTRASVRGAVSGAARLPTSAGGDEAPAVASSRGIRRVLPDVGRREYATDQADADAKSFFTMLADAGGGGPRVPLRRGRGRGRGPRRLRRGFPRRGGSSAGERVGVLRPGGGTASV